MNRNVKRLVLQFGNMSPPYGKGDTPLQFVPEIIAELRKYGKRVVRDEDGENVIYDVPILRATSDPSWMLEIVAEYTVTMAENAVEHRSISVMMLTDTMYVIRFKGSKFKQYWQLREGKVFIQLIDGSEDLFMNGSYTSGRTIGTASRVNVDGVQCNFRERVVVNRENTFFYFNILYFYNGEDDKRIFMARALVYVIHLFGKRSSKDTGSSKKEKEKGKGKWQGQGKGKGKA